MDKTDRLLKWTSPYDEFEDSGPNPLNLDKPLGQMTDDELLSFGIKSFAGGIIGGIGSLIVGQLLSRMFAGTDTVGPLLEKQLDKMRSIFQEVLDAEALMAMTGKFNSTCTFMHDYRIGLDNNTHLDDALEHAYEY